jgi:hypothetical protein
MPNQLLLLRIMAFKQAHLHSVSSTRSSSTPSAICLPCCQLGFQASNLLLHKQHNRCSTLPASAASPIGVCHKYQAEAVTGNAIGEMSARYMVPTGILWRFGACDVAPGFIGQYQP